jgi:CubicO group peptidase (beta-lactamase class C family)
MRHPSGPVVLWIAAFIGFQLTSQGWCQNPKRTWSQYESVEQAGFSPDKLQKARQYYDSLQSSAFMVVQSGKVVAAWGDVNRRFKIASIRKSLINSLYGIYHGNGMIDLSKTLGQLNISDQGLLSELEKSAQIIHLLKSRSGVYHRAAAETDSIRQYRPARDSHPPDTFWFYNNWDFNVLGTIFERLTKTSMFEAFDKKIAAPLQMEDFRMMDCDYFYEREYSDHPAYHFKMTARDLARYGQMFLQKGVWNRRQVIPREWIEDSTYPHSKHGGGTKIGRWYGYLWGVSEYYRDYGMYFASGVGGQFLAVFPAVNMVIVHLADTYKSHKVLDRELTELFDLILGSRTGDPVLNPRLIPLRTRARNPENLYRNKLDYSKYVGDFESGGRRISIIEADGHLIVKDFDQKFRLFPMSPARFYLEDMEIFINFVFDDHGNIVKVYYDG